MNIVYFGTVLLIRENDVSLYYFILFCFMMNEFEFAFFGRRRKFCGNIFITVL